MAKSEMESLWRDLHVEILENIFTFLPISSVCRFKMLSKSWNRYLTSPAFWHAQASRTSPEHLVAYVLGSSRGGWDVLDMAKRMFLFSDDLLRNHRTDQHGRLLGKGMFQTVAAAGGLYCVQNFNLCLYTPCFFVCNPVLKTFKELPHVYEDNLLPQRIVMSTDTIVMEYEIIVFNISLVASIQPSVLVYKSKTSSWKVAPYRSMNE